MMNKKIISYVSVCMVILWMTSCTPDSNAPFEMENQHSNTPHALAKYLPQGYRVVTQEEFLRNPEEKTIVTEITDWEPKSIRNILKTNVIAFEANKDFEQAKEVGIDIPEKSVVFLYNDTNLGRVTEIMSLEEEDVYVSTENILPDPIGSKSLEEENPEGYALLLEKGYSENEIEQEYEKVIKEYNAGITSAQKKALANKEGATKSIQKTPAFSDLDIADRMSQIIDTHKQSNTGFKGSSATSSDLDNYFYTVIKNKYQYYDFNHHGYSDKILYIYQVICRLSVGSGQFDNQEKVFLEVMFRPYPGVQLQAKRQSATGSICDRKQEVHNALQRFKLEVFLDTDWALEGYEPSVAGGDGTGANSYSNSLNFTVSLKPLKPSEIVEPKIGYTLGESFSYSLPDVRMYNLFQGRNAVVTGSNAGTMISRFYSNRYISDNPNNVQKLNWDFQLISGPSGNWRDGRGLVSNKWGGGAHNTFSSLFADSSRWPQFLKSNLRISSYAVYSLPLDIARKVDFKKLIVVTSHEKLKYIKARRVAGVFCLTGPTKFDGSKRVSGLARTAFSMPLDNDILNLE